MFYCLYSVKTYFKNEGEIESFSDKWKRRECVGSTPVQQELPKDVLQVEAKCNLMETCIPRKERAKLLFYCIFLKKTIDSLNQ